MKVLIACEESGAVRDAFIRAGHDAMSCDLKPTSAPGPHYEGSLFDLPLEDYDLVVAFPPCTYLCKAQQWRCNKDEKRAALRDEAVEFVKEIWRRSKRLALENPPGYLSTGFRDHSQIVYPFWFGDPYRKEIGLWLKDVPPLIATCYNTIRKPVHNHVNGRMSQAQKSEIKSSWKYYPLMAEAMATQWGNIDKL